MQQALYRKYRPEKLTELVGQEEAVSLISKQIEKDSLGHAYLFSGPRGVGKTSLARIIATQLGCDPVFDITEMPYKVVATYRDNKIAPMLYPNVVAKLGEDYNNAYVLIETNDIGQQVVDILHEEIEYDNIFSTVTEKNRQYVSPGFGKVTRRGVSTSKQVKRQGCFSFKSLMEEQKLLCFDAETIHEISTFVEKGNTYQADEGYHDDLVMCLVIFSWCANQRYFKELTNVDVRGQMFTDQQNAIEADMAPFGFIDDGINDPNGNDGYFVDAGEIWRPVTYRKGE